MTKARDLSKLLSTSNGKIAGSNLDVSFENISDTGTEGTKVATGTTAQRGSTTGQWRYNTTTNFFEGRAASGSFLSLEPSPTVTSVDVSEVASAGGGNQTIVVTGTNFSTGGTISFIGTSASFNASTTTFNSGTQLTAVAPKASFLNAQEPYKVRFTSTSGLIGTSSTGLINVDSAPTFNVASGSLGILYDTGRASTNLTAVTATDADGDSITFAVHSGSIPSGLTFNSNGTFSGTASAVGSNTTSSFTIRATAGGKTSDRAYTIEVKAPTTTAFSYTGSDQSFTVPSGVTSLVFAMWGAGSAASTAGSSYGGGGGYGTGTLDLTGITTIKIVTGQGGTYGTLAGGRGSGGGYSGIFNGSVTHGNAIAVVGGGGGGANGTSEDGGAGGGLNQNGTTGNSNGATHTQRGGQGATTSAGGAAGYNYYNNAQSGSALTGGDGAQPNAGYRTYGGGGSYGQGGDPGAGAGGGYYGGGGSDANTSAGGGSGYANTSIVSSITTSTGNKGSGTAVGTSDALYISGINSGNTNSSGDNGYVVFKY